MQVILFLHNIRSTYNVGAILRTAEGLGVKEVICSGYTPWYTAPGMLPHLSAKLYRQIHKTALGAERMLTVNYDLYPFQTLKDLRKGGYRIVGLENNIKKPTILLNDYDSVQKIGEKIVLVLGEEVDGMSSRLQDEMDVFLEIPMKGKKESFNVSVAASIALFVLTSLN